MLNRDRHPLRDRAHSSLAEDRTKMDRDLVMSSTANGGTEKLCYSSQ